MQTLKRACVCAAITALAVAAFMRPTVADRSGVARSNNLLAVDAFSMARTATTAANADTIVLAEFTFDNAGTPDPQGWSTHDISGDLAVFTHVANSTELDGGDFGRLNVLAGNQSLWCGAVQSGSSPGLCSYALLPGYGNSWEQAWVSREFAHLGDVTVSYLFSADTEASYDYVYVYYLDEFGWRHNLASFDGVVPKQVVSFVIPDTLIGPSTRIGFEFDSDAYADDEDGIVNTDGAFLLDSLTVSDAGGVIDFEDFEDENPGDTGTVDGDWTAIRMGVFGGSYGALFDGDTVVQEDTLVHNDSYLWGFFNGSPSIGGCGYPPVPVIPREKLEPLTGGSRYIHEEARSPVIDLSQDKHGNPVPSGFETVLLEADVYFDIDFNTLVFLVWRARGVGAACDEWGWNGHPMYGTQKQWRRISLDITPYISEGATGVQVGMGPRNLCPWFCGTTVYIPCETQSPMIDNVRIVVVGDSIATAGDSPPPVTALQQNYPNPFNPSTSIAFTLAESGHATIEIFDVGGRRIRTLVSQTYGAGSHVAGWDGRDNSGRDVASGVYFYRLTAGGASESRKMVLAR